MSPGSLITTISRHAFPEVYCLLVPLPHPTTEKPPKKIERSGIRLVILLEQIDTPRDGYLHPRGSECKVRIVKIVRCSRTHSHCGFCHSISTTEPQSFGSRKDLNTAPSRGLLGLDDGNRQTDTYNHSAILWSMLDVARIRG